MNTTQTTQFKTAIANVSKRMDADSSFDAFGGSEMIANAFHISLEDALKSITDYRATETLPIEPCGGCGTEYHSATPIDECECCTQVKAKRRREAQQFVAGGSRLW